MTEEFLQFVWKYRLFKDENLYSTNGDKIEILDIGKHNQNAGPDFFDARIKINDVLWAGNIEIHLKSSLWYVHNHHHDPSYNNVILHVVFQNDTDILINERKLPVLLLQLSSNLIENYNSLMSSKKWIPCYDEISSVESFFVKNWLDRMILERLERKSTEVKSIFESNKNSWEETFYQLVARCFGMKVNADPFQQLAQALPLRVLARQKNSLLQIEALLFGQAGMLSECQSDDYYLALKAEYEHLSNKYKLKSMPFHRWKWLRLRPGNFPTIRIAQMAALIHKSSSLFSKIIENPDYNHIRNLFDVQVSKYWEEHYRFGVQSELKSKKLGEMAIHSIIINSIVPILFYFGEQLENLEIKEKAVLLLEDIPAEKNSVIEKWQKCGVQIKSAWHSQALLQLKANYCDEFKCLQCEFGNRIIRFKNLN